MSEKQHRAGFVAIVGRPNAGKSTLVNRLVGQKIAIVTPGLHDARTVLNRQMMKEVAAALEGIDVLVLMADASVMEPHSDTLLLERAKRFAGPAILVLNKVDKVPKQK